MITLSSELAKINSHNFRKFRKSLLETRRELGITQTEMTEALDFDVKEFEAYDFIPTTYQIKAYALAIGVEVNYTINKYRK